MNVHPPARMICNGNFRAVRADADIPRSRPSILRLVPLQMLQRAGWLTSREVYEYQSALALFGGFDQLARCWNDAGYFHRSAHVLIKDFERVVDAEPSDKGLGIYPK